MNERLPGIRYSATKTVASLSVSILAPPRVVFFFFFGGALFGVGSWNLECDELLLLLLDIMLHLLRALCSGAGFGFRWQKCGVGNVKGMRASLMVIGKFFNALCRGRRRLSTFCIKSFLWKRKAHRKIVL